MSEWSELKEALRVIQERQEEEKRKIEQIKLALEKVTQEIKTLEKTLGVN